MTDTALDRARRDFEEWAQAAMEYEPAHLCELGEDDPHPESCIPCNLVKSARRLEAAAQEDGKRITLESLSRMDNDGPIEEHPEIRDALQAMVQAHEAAARLAGRVEQAEWSANRCANLRAHSEVWAALKDERDRLRELAAAGKEAGK